MQIFAVVVSLAIAAVGVALFVKAIREIIAVIKLGQPAANRSNDKGARWLNMFKETLAHTRMLQWAAVGVGHWFVFVGFGLLFFTLLTAFGQLFDPHFTLPLIGTFFLFEWVTELFTVVMVVAITAFIAYRLSRPKERERGPRGRFYGSTMWQGYFVEAVILGVGLCILALRGAEYAIAQYGEHPENASAFHFPFTAWLGGLMDGMSESALANFIYLVAMVKIVISFTWMIVLSQNLTMGVAWHRFSAWFNIWFKRKSDGGTALGALQPMMSGGKPINFEDIEEMDEDTALGVGKVEDFSWKGILDFTSCTECGRCQSQCPAWNTEKPLSPKLLITNLRDHAYAKAPYLLASSDEERDSISDQVKAEADRDLVGATEGWAWEPSGGAVIDPDVLWSCTSCGACVQQCPVDIEHVDHIVDMRRYQVLVESNFPAELNQLFKGLENKGNPWNMSPNARLDWAKDLPFEVKVVGEQIEDLDEVDWLFWVGCAGAYEDRAKKTTRAVAELLDLAGVSFGVLGNGETCTGDPARRAGNEFVFQGLAAQNAETFKETKVKQVVSTCAHCFNTLKNEYRQFGVELEVVHHTQLLNRLVREGRLTPVATNGASANGGRSITYHDPCYLGRHNQVYSPPRELLSVIPNAELKEMPRNSERSFCCGAGGARMWMEEKIGERINLNRTTEAVETGADQIATGCPFCRVMLSDGLTAKQADGSAREEIEVLDVAQMLLASVKGGAARRTPAAATAASATAGSADGAAAAAGAGSATALLDRPGTSSTPTETKAEPDAGDVTQTKDTVSKTEQVGANAAASEEKDPQAEASQPINKGSLFDTPEKSEPAGPAGSGSLFDTPEKAKPAEPAPSSESADIQSQTTESKSGAGSGSLFDVADTKSAPETAAEPAPDAVDANPETAEIQPPPTESGTALGSGSLFDVADTKPEPQTAAQPAADGQDTEQTDENQSPATESGVGPAAAPSGTSKIQPPATESGTASDDTEIQSPATESTGPASTSGIGTGSLFDIPSEMPEPDGEPAAQKPAEDTEPADAATTDPDSTDVTSPDISEEESTAPEDDAAVQNLEEAGEQTAAEKPKRSITGDDAPSSLFDL